MKRADIWVTHVVPDVFLGHARQHTITLNFESDAFAKPSVKDHEISRILTEAVPATVAATVFYNAAPVLEAIAARRQPIGTGLGLRLLWRLIRRPIWLAGLACEILGFGLEVFALAIAPLILVQPLAASGLVLVVLGGWLFLGERLSVVGALGMVELVAGVVLLTACLTGSERRGELPAADRLWPAVAAATVIAGLLVTAASQELNHGSRTAGGGLFGAAAGIGFTVASVATRYLGIQIHHFTLHSFARALTGPAPYLLAVASILAMSVLQRGLQSGAALAAVPASTAVASVLPVPAGVLLFGEVLPHGIRAWGFGAALALTLAGVAQLGSQRAVVVAMGGEQAEPDPAAAVS